MDLRDKLIKASDNYFKKTDLIKATIHQIENYVKLLIEKNPSCVYVPDNYGNTALIYASFYGDKNIVELLIKKD